MSKNNNGIWQHPFAEPQQGARKQHYELLQKTAQKLSGLIVTFHCCIAWFRDSVQLRINSINECYAGAKKSSLENLQKSKKELENTIFR